MKKVGNIRLLIFICVLASFLTACRDEASDVQTDTDTGFARMNDSIDQIYARTDFMVNTYENDRRVQIFEEKIGGKDEVEINLMFRYAIESLNNGETHQAISAVMNILDVDPSYPEVTESNLMLHKFLGIAYLRMAEQNNCMHYHNDASCIVPFKEAAVHRDKSGSEKAIDKYSEILAKDPNDMESRWLLNLAYMTLGRHPQDVPDEYLIELPDQKDVQALENIATRTGLDYNDLSGGLITDDFNNDGLLDIVISSWSFSGKVKYFQNQGKDGFEDVTKESKLNLTCGGLNLKQADYNNDGNLDFLILRGAWKPNFEWGIPSNSLIRNNGDGTFSDVTFEAGMYSEYPTQSAEWFDFNNDGWLDLFIANETTRSSKRPHPCELYVNQGDGTFKEVAEEKGVDFVGYYKGVTSGDIDNDGWLDLFISNLDGANILLVNEYDQNPASPFRNIANKAGVEQPRAAFPAWFFDFDNDGWDDLFVASYGKMAFQNQAGQFANEMLGKPVRTEPSKLYRNRGDLTFEDVSGYCCTGKAISTMGSNYGDLNNDGFPDFYLGTGAPDYRAVVPNRFFLNIDGRRFRDQTFGMGVGHIQKGHGTSFCDLDNDGDQDIYIVMGGAYKGDKFPNALFENPGYGNNWIKLELEGVECNRSAIGSKIRVRGIRPDGSELTVYSTVNSGGSFGADPLAEHIGLSDVSEIREVAVRWPGSEEYHSMGPLGINKAYRIKQGDDPDPVSLHTFEFNKNMERSHNHSSMH